MLTIRQAQLDAISQARLRALQADLHADAVQRFSPVCDELGEARLVALIEGCIDECLQSGAAARGDIVRALRSLLQTQGLQALSLDEAMRQVRSELQTRQLMSMLETLEGLESR